MSSVIAAPTKATIDGLDDESRALAEHVGSGDPDDAEMWLDDAEDVLAALLDEHGWTVTRKGER